MRQLRERRGLSQELLAELADLSVSHVSLLERGRRTPTLSSAARISYALGLTLTELVKRAEAEAEAASHWLPEH